MKSQEPPQPKYFVVQPSKWQYDMATFSTARTTAIQTCAILGASLESSETTVPYPLPVVLKNPRPVVIEHVSLLAALKQTNPPLRVAPCCDD